MCSVLFSAVTKLLSVFYVETHYTCYATSSKFGVRHKLESSNVPVRYLKLECSICPGKARVCSVRFLAVTKLLSLFFYEEIH